jgi:hypothetical protein
MMGWRAIGVLGGLAFVLASCGGESSGPKDAGDDADALTIDGAPSDTDAADAATTNDAAAADADGAADAATDAAMTDGAPSDGAKPDAPTLTCPTTPDGGASCNALVNIAPAVTIAAGTGDMPVGMGGPIFDGTYFLSELTAYAGSGISTGVFFTQLMVIAGCSAELVEGVNVHKTFNKNPVGIVPNWTMVCSSKVGDAPVVFSSFTGTPTTLTLYSTSAKFYATYTKQ